MCITGSVGQNGRNDKGDVKRIQLLLNMNAAACGLEKPLVADGLCGSGTIGVLNAFQRHAGVMSNGRAEPGDQTMKAFQDRLPRGLTKEKLWTIMTGATEAHIKRYHEPLLNCLERNGIDTPLRVAHFLAQVGHECGDFRYQEEIADGSAYEGRKDLGNTQPGDGKRFKGRGLIQLTGRSNYTRYGEAIGRDLVTGDNARQVADDPELAIDVACWYWTSRKLNQWADEDNVRELTRRINGGYNGLEDRELRLARAKWVLAIG
ncbi:glycoside hydrolase family 19 protein [Azospirillum rugosum]|uniref:Chitinase n=1 Tax=Azospirillum rugosum TaxID=416170 RepID=A0ABS4T043_9PROT|nr:glycoside hydrolase family 19 protein [Azospirillum rugosum]MBP2297010.1 putative chitinase [Azospirillum rugosum]MDQ0530642.1 putative chitinase [Azospirillum rugosum]